MALFTKRTPNRERYLTKRIIIFLAGGVVLSLIALVFLMLCQLPCPDTQYALNYDQWKRSMTILAPSKFSRYTLAILIISAPDNVAERNAIRQTWASKLDDGQVLSRFVVGTAALATETSLQLEQENASQKDMVLLNNVKDSYKELTFKVLQALIWINKHVDYQYVLKVDDDSFVVVPGILSKLLYKPKERLYWGFFDGRANVKISGKWKETNWVLCDKYLPYARGGGYVLSFDLVNFIARNSELLQLFISEDVSVGTWLAPLKVSRHHDQNFDTEYISRGCFNSYLVMHKQSTVSIRELHYNLKTTGRLCKTETMSRGSYEYNWNYPPSQCCNRSNVVHKFGRDGQLT